MFWVAGAPAADCLVSDAVSFQSANRPSLSDFENGAYGISLNLNCSGRLTADGPHPPSGLSTIWGSENEAIVAGIDLVSPTRENLGNSDAWESWLVSCPP